MCAISQVEPCILFKEGFYPNLAVNFQRQYFPKIPPKILSESMNFIACCSLFLQNHEKCMQFYASTVLEM